MRTILVVDDDAWVRGLARDVLAREGYRVLEASDGQDAIRVSAEHPGPIHLLLTDVMMPGMNGCDLAAGLSALLPGLKVMFMSAYDRDFLVDPGPQPGRPGHHQAVHHRVPDPAGPDGAGRRRPRIGRHRRPAR